MKRLRYTPSRSSAAGWLAFPESPGTGPDQVQVEIGRKLMQVSARPVGFLLLNPPGWVSLLQVRGPKRGSRGGPAALKVCSSCTNR